MTRRALLHPEAEDELVAAIEWYEQASPRLGIELLIAVDSELRALERSIEHSVPLLHVSPSLNIRRVMLGRFPYSIVFMPLEDAIAVLAFAHHRRKPGYWRERL